MQKLILILGKCTANIGAENFMSRVSFMMLRSCKLWEKWPVSCGESLTLELWEWEEAGLAGEDSERQVRGIQGKEEEGLQRRINLGKQIEVLRWESFCECSPTSVGIAWNANVSHHSFLSDIRWVKAGMWQHVEKLEKPNMIQCRPKAIENWIEVEARGAEMLNVMAHFSQWHTMSLGRRT